MYDTISADNINSTSIVEIMTKEGVLSDGSNLCNINRQLMKELFDKLDVHYNTQVTVLELVKCAKCPENLQEDVDFSECRNLLYSSLGFYSTPTAPITDKQMKIVADIMKGLEEPYFMGTKYVSLEDVIDYLNQEDVIKRISLAIDDIDIVEKEEDAFVINDVEQDSLENAKTPNIYSSSMRNKESFKDNVSPQSFYFNQALGSLGHMYSAYSNAKTHVEGAEIDAVFDDMSYVNVEDDSYASLGREGSIEHLPSCDLIDQALVEEYNDTMNAINAIEGGDTVPVNYGSTAPMSMVTSEVEKEVIGSGVQVGEAAAPFGLLGEKTESFLALNSRHASDAVQEDDELYNPKMPAKFQRKRPSSAKLGANVSRKNDDISTHAAVTELAPPIEEAPPRNLANLHWSQMTEAERASLIPEKHVGEWVAIEGTEPFYYNKLTKQCTTEKPQELLTDEMYMSGKIMPRNFKPITANAD